VSEILEKEAPLARRAAVPAEAACRLASLPHARLLPEPPGRRSSALHGVVLADIGRAILIGSWIVTDKEMARNVVLPKLARNWSLENHVGASLGRCGLVFNTPVLRRLRRGLVFGTSYPTA
jgi:hypothetical protein